MSNEAPKRLRFGEWEKPKVINHYTLMHAFHAQDKYIDYLENKMEPIQGIEKHIKGVTVKVDLYEDGVTTEDLLEVFSDVLRGLGYVVKGDLEIGSYSDVD